LEKTNSKILINHVDFSSCYGCGVCAIICPQKIIKIELNDDGFFAPFLDDAKDCLNCGLCLSVCAYHHIALPIIDLTKVKYYAGWNDDELIRRRCSSGGIAYAIGKHLIKQGYKAIGVKYNIDCNRAEHYVSETVESFTHSIGSKYLPSYALDAFSQINLNDKFFVTGTPCQIDSLRRYIKKLGIEENFILLDFFCHGVPSMNLWKKYSESIEKKLGRIKYLEWRNKGNGWHNSYVMKAEGVKLSDSGIINGPTYGQKKHGGNVYYSSKGQGDLFYHFFLGNLCLNDACYDHCKYKMSSSSADIRIGDLWGNKYKSDEDGVSALIIFNEKGEAIISEMKDLTLIEDNPQVVMEGQMKISPKRKSSFNYVKHSLKRNRKLSEIALVAQLIDLLFDRIRKIST